jgi:oligopeptide/dipeptide ABC transporter ATP-binding protein
MLTKSDAIYLTYLCSDLDKNNPMLLIEGLVQYFPKRGLNRREDKIIVAVDNVNLSVFKSETLGLVGESGSGKTTLGRTILRLLEPKSGAIYLRGKDIVKLNDKQMRMVRMKMQMVFQNPHSSLNPRMTAGQIIGRPLKVFGRAKKSEISDRVRNALQMVGLIPDDASKYPHEFSGGQRQRIGIARAIILNPEFLALDEPTSALDVSVQAQILNLLSRLREQFELTYLFISHDLGVVRHMCDRIAVMFRGQLLEIANTEELLENACHPYTKLLIASVPTITEKTKQKRILRSAPPTVQVNGAETESRCKFYSRCEFRKEVCRQEEPNLVEIENGHKLRCHLYD